MRQVSTQIIHAIPTFSDAVLRFNILPSHAEAQEILSSIELEEHALEKYDQEMTRLQKMLEVLEHKRRALSLRIERRRSLLAPIRRLPIDILERIFSWVSSPDYSLNIHPYTSSWAYGFRVPPKTPTIALTHICQHWRQVINESPQLWSSISISIPSERKDAIEHMLGLHLARSKECALDISLSASYFGKDNPDHTTTLAVLDMLYPHFYRIADLDIWIPAGAFEAAPHPLSLPSLLSFHASLTLLPEWFRVVLLHAPRLTSIHVDALPYQTQMIPYHQLTVLDVLRVEFFTDLLSALRLCTSLRSLKFGTAFAGNPDTRHGPQELASLCHLSFNSFADKNPIPVILRSFKLPQLASLNVHVGSQNTQEFSSASLIPFIDLIHRSRCSLRHFALDIPCLHLPGAEIREFLHLCPKLVRLRVDMFRLDGEGARNQDTVVYQFLDILRTSLPDAQTLLNPNLAEVTLRETLYARIDHTTAFALLDMIEARRDLGLVISKSKRVRQSLTFDINLGMKPQEVSPEVVEAVDARILKLADKGVKCCIAWANP
ncbi:hypothetical protein VNI00_004585 [Paramarasmius palmivorus]|uniref:F-box domain-containing protein n=1 Tax=Paramarasmius palmivorus TaxID=297713 RepID=A0AAW0DKV6_9AGAR